MALQEKYDLRWLTYYVNREGGTSFCLAEAPSREAVEACHRDAHGAMLPYHVVEVDEAMVALFLGTVMTPEIGFPWSESPFRTLVVADLANSAQIALQHGDVQEERVLQELVTLVQQALPSRVPAKQTGHGVLVSLPSAGKAVETALAIQHGVKVRNLSQQEPLMEVRIGLNAGEPLESEGALFGAALAVATEVCGMAPPNAILVTGVVRDLCAGKGFSFAERGEAEAGHLSGIRLYEVLPSEPVVAAAPVRLLPNDLSAREVEVLGLLASGASNSQIGEALFISTNTVARHVGNILNKTGARNRTEAAAFALRERLV